MLDIVEFNEPPQTLVITNLPKNASEVMLREVFSQFGEISRINFGLDGAGKRIGQVFYYAGAKLDLAIKEMNGSRILGGKAIQVQKSSESQIK